MKLLITNEWSEFLSKIKWTPIIFWILMHIASCYGIYLALFSIQYQTLIFLILLGHLYGFGTMAAAHRYYTHQSFKAKLPLRIILALLQTYTGQLSIIDWATSHHLHHKYTETDADCVNINRGFFFAHIGWYFIEEHPLCAKKRKEIDVNYLMKNPIVKFQHKYYWPLAVLLNTIVPTLIPYYYFGDTLINGFFVCFVLRYTYGFQVANCGNSVVHYDKWGTKPYDNSITATNNRVLNYTAQGTAYHNFHHVFPWDYSENEFGSDQQFNMNTLFIDFFAYIGWAYDLKKAPQKLINQRKERTGDHSKTNTTMHPILDYIIGMFFTTFVLLLIPLFWLLY